jgi:phospholipid transport system substrate-binding protein
MRRLIAAMVLALAAGGVPALAADSGQAAQQLVQETTDKVLDRLQAERESIKAEPRRVYGLVEALVLPHFDFEAMSRLVLAKYWRDATPAQRGRFVELFRDLLVRTYSTALLEYTGQEVRYKPVHAGDDARRVKVPTEVVPPDGGPAIPIVYSLYDKEGRWLVYDISIDGVSLLLNYRNTYTTEVRQKGIDALIARMEQHRNGGSGS